MGLGPIIRGGRQILSKAAKNRKGVTSDIARKEKKLTAKEIELKDAEKTLRNKRQAAKNIEKSTNTKQRIKAGQEVVQIKDQIKTLEQEIKGLVAAIQGNVKRTHKAKKTPDWLRTDTAGEVPDTAGLTKRKPSGQQEHVDPRKKGGKVTYRAGGGLVSKKKTMYGYKEGGQV